jgi:hypothetical protein
MLAGSLSGNSLNLSMRQSAAPTKLPSSTSKALRRIQRHHGATLVIITASNHRFKVAAATAGARPVCG